MNEKLKAMSLKDAQLQIERKVYEATRLLEELERAGKIRGNGHHMRQRLAGYAKTLVKDRWLDKL